MLNEIFKEIGRHLVKEGAKEVGDRIDNWGETPKEREVRKRKLKELKRIEKEKERMSNVVPALIWIIIGIVAGLWSGSGLCFIFIIIGILILI